MKTRKLISFLDPNEWYAHFKISPFSGRIMTEFLPLPHKIQIYMNINQGAPVIQPKDILIHPEVEKFGKP